MLKTRVITAIILASLLFGVLFALPPAAGAVAFGVVVLAGAWEWAAFAGFAGPGGRLIYTVVVALLGAAAWLALPRPSQWLLLMAAAAVWWSAALLWLGLRPHAVTRPLAALSGLLVLVPSGVGLGRLVLLAPAPRGASLILFMLLLVWATDIGAYFAGRRFGRLKLAPQVSPNKTWEGVIGGVALGALVAVLGARWFAAPAVAFIALGIVVIGASMVGDLTESMFKRYAGLKDSGSLLPGHGGVLDRIDSITSAVPFFAIGLGWIGYLG